MRLYKNQLPRKPSSFLEDDLELPPIGWQLFILGSSQSDSIAFPSFLDTHDIRLLAEPLSGNPVNKVTIGPGLLMTPARW
jgi:hypothetical protein